MEKKIIPGPVRTQITTTQKMNDYENIDFHSRISIAEFPGDGLKYNSKPQSNFANITFAEKSRYDRIFQQFTHKVGESEKNNINIFQNAQAL